MREDFDWFEFISSKIHWFEDRFRIVPMYIVVHPETLSKIEMSDSIRKRITYVRDSNTEALGTSICGAKILKSINVEKDKVLVGFLH